MHNLSVKWTNKERFLFLVSGSYPEKPLRMTRKNRKYINLFNMFHEAKSEVSFRFKELENLEIFW